VDLADTDLEQLLHRLPTADADAAAAVRKRAAQVLRPAGAFARLDEVAAWLAGWQHTIRPSVARPTTVLFAADHGVAGHGVSAYPADVTVAMLRALNDGVATANAMAAVVGAELVICDVGVGRPTGPLHLQSALSPERFAECVAAGRRAVRSLNADLLVLGELGIGNTTAAAAVCAALYDGAAADWTGRGTGVDDAGYARKTAVVDAARQRLGKYASPLDVLREVGGAELAAIAGAVLQARLQSIPVILDGYVVTAAVAPLDKQDPGALDHCIAGHCSGQPGHRRVLDRLGKPPLLDLGLRLGEGTGAMAAIPLVRMAAACVTDVATFAEWGLDP
jgi:nicotinate-nucleotide--dimethylbenzimidazole phosphoribosyltransferase